MDDRLRSPYDHYNTLMMSVAVEENEYIVLFSQLCNTIRLVNLNKGASMVGY